nr:isochorismatase family cysteine hydrolase [Micromonospora sp. DSM 115978]
MGRILIRGEYGQDIIDELAPADGEIVIDKPGKGAFYATNFGDVLAEKGITHLVVTGVTTEVCVHTTVREANDRGFECLVLSDCVGSYFPRVPAGRPRHDRRAGRHLRLGRTLDRLPRRVGPRRRAFPRHGFLKAERHTMVKIGKSGEATEDSIALPYWVKGDTNAF